MRQDQVGLAPSMSDEAFIDFYTCEHDTQVRRAYLMLGRGAAAQDVVANAFMAVYQRWGLVDQPGPYLNRCVLNGCRDAGRKTAREKVMARPLDESVDSMGSLDEADEMGELLIELPFRQRAAIVLRFYGGCSEAEIAHHLNCRPGTVGSLIHRGLKALRDQLTLEDNHDAY